MSAMDIMQAVICHSVCQAVTRDAVLMSAQHRGMWNNFITGAIKFCLQAVSLDHYSFIYWSLCVMTSCFIISAINNLSCGMLTLPIFHISYPDNQHHWCFPFLDWMFVVLYLLHHQVFAYQQHRLCIRIDSISSYHQSHVWISRWSVCLVSDFPCPFHHETLNVKVNSKRKETRYRLLNLY